MGLPRVIELKVRYGHTYQLSQFVRLDWLSGLLSQYARQETREFRPQINL